MITQFLAPLPQAYSLLSPSLPEVAEIAFVLAAALLALLVAMAGTVNTVSSSARKPQDLTLTSNANRVTETPANRLAMPLNIQKLTIAGADNPVASYLAETPAYRLAMLHFLHKKSHRHAALLLKQIGPYSSLRHPMIHTRSRRSSRKGSWFTLATSVLPLNIQKLTLIGSVNSHL